jgi:hypothetical protein
MMQHEAQQAAAQMQASGRIRVIVQDNGSIHKSQDVQQKWSQWESQGLYIFFLPKYCSEMNKIELEWQQLKTHELVGQMFEDELDKRLCGYGWSRGQRSRGEIHHRAF